MNKPKLNQPDNGESITINKTIPSKQFEDIFVIGTTNMNKYQEALNRIDTYRVNKSLKLDIKDILTLQELVDKATPKKVRIETIFENNKELYELYFCPNCGLTLFSIPKYCSRCGQHLDNDFLDWSNENE